MERFTFQSDREEWEWPSCSLPRIWEQMKRRNCRIFLFSHLSLYVMIWGWLIVEYHSLVHFRVFTALYMPRFMRTRCIKARGGNFVIKFNFYVSVVIITEAYRAKKIWLSALTTNLIYLFFSLTQYASVLS